MASKADRLEIFAKVWPVFVPESQPIMRFGEATKVGNNPFLQEYLAIAEFMNTFNLFDILN